MVANSGGSRFAALCRDKLNLSEVLVAAGTSVTAAVPIARATNEELNLTGRFTSLQVAGSWAPSGFVQAQFDQIVVSFDPIWANPMWSAMNLPVESEKDQILRLLRLTLLDLPRPVTAAPVQVLRPPVADTPSQSSFSFSLRGGGMMFLQALISYAFSIGVAFSIASCILVKTLTLKVSLENLDPNDDDWEKVSKTPPDEPNGEVERDRTAVGGG